MPAAVSKGYNMLKKQIGSSLMPVMLLLGGVGTTAAVSYAGYQSQSQQTAIARYIAEDIQQIQSAAMLYLSDNNINSFDDLKDPNALGTLAGQGYYSGAFESPMGSIYRTRVDETTQEFIVEVDATVHRYARRTASIVNGGEVFGGTSIRSSIGLPSRSELYKDLLSRYEDPREGYEYRQQFEMDVHLEMGGNNFADVNDIEAERIEAAQYNVRSIRTSELATDELRVGDASFTSEGGALNIASSNTAIDANVNLRGDLVGEGGSATGIGWLQGDDIRFLSADFEDLESQQLDAQTFESSMGNIDTLTGQSLDYSSGTLVNTTAGNVMANNQATITNLSGSLLDYGTASFDSIQSESLDIAAALNPGGNAGSSGRFANATASTGSAVGTTVDGQLKANDLVVAAGISTGNEFEVTNQATVTETEVTESASADKVKATSVTSRDLYVTKATAAELRGRKLTGTTGTGHNVNSGKFETLNSTISTGTITQLEFEAMSGTSGGTRHLSLSQEMSAQSAKLSGDLTARNFNASNDVSTASGNSINSNYSLIKNLNDDLVECTSENGVCMPRTPDISLSCQGGCLKREASSTLQFNLVGSITNCKRGCSFNFSMPSDLRVGTCSWSGNVAPGNNGQVSCQFFADYIPPSTTETYEVRLHATDARNSDFSSSRSVTLSATNTTPDEEPLSERLLSGCQVNAVPNAGQAQVQPNRCSNYGAHQFHSPGMGFSVGDIRSSDGSSYLFEDESWAERYDVEWTTVSAFGGDMPFTVYCSSFYCNANSYTTPAYVTMEVTVTDKNTGDSVTRRIQAQDCTAQGEMDVPMC